MAPRGRPRIFTDEERAARLAQRIASPKYRCANRDRSYKWVLANPEKRKAIEELTEAIRIGQIVRPGECSTCGKGGRIHGHHEDYSKPLKVIWLCSSCHQRVHREKKCATLPE